MRHQKKTVKLGRTASHRDALLANQVCSLIEHSRIKTTLAKAKAVRPLAERMITLGKKGTLHARRTAMSVLHQKDAVKKLFDDVAPRSAERNGGYTRIIKLGYRQSDAAAVAFIEWVDAPVMVEKEEAIEVTPLKKTRAKKSEDTASGEPAAKKPKASAKKEEGAEPAAE